MNVKIKGIEISYPDKFVDNQYFIDLFDKQGKDIRSLLKALGRKKRGIGDNETTSTVSLGAEAAFKVLESTGLSGEDIDLIVFTSQFPEYTSPAQSLIIHNLINGTIEKENMVMDINVNCVGMVVALDLISRYLLQKKQFKRVLLIGADYASIQCNKNDPAMYPMFGDAGCAIILEKTDEDCGLIDSVSYTNSDQYKMFKYPNCGTSFLYDDKIDVEKKKIVTSNQPSTEAVTEAARKSVEKLLRENNLKLSDIKCFCFSQASAVLRKECSKAIGISEDKILYIGDKYGYTGTSSPFIAFYEGLKNNIIQRGDYIIFWSLGINWTTSGILFKY